MDEDIAAGREFNDAAARRWQVGKLMVEGREATIDHDGHDNRLRLTAKNGLILTKLDGPAGILPAWQAPMAAGDCASGTAALVLQGS